MKKIFYGIPLRAAAFIMCIIVTAGAAVDIMSLTAAVRNDKSSLSGDPESCYEIVTKLSMGSEKLSQMINSSDNVPEEFPVSNELEYYAENLKTHKVISNTDNKDRSYYTDTEEYAYYIFERYGKNIYEDGNRYTRPADAGIHQTIADEDNEDNEDDYVIYIKIKDEVLSDLLREWEYSAAIVQNIISNLPTYAVLLLIGVVYLSFASGRIGKDDEIHMMVIDRVPIDIQAAFIVILALIAACGIFALASIRSSSFDTDAYSMVIGGIFAAAAVTSYMSCVRNLKNHTFAQRILTVRLIKWLWEKCMIVVRPVLRLIFRTLPRKAVNVYAAVKKLAAARMSVKLMLAAVIVYSGILTFFAAFLGAFIYEGDPPAALLMLIIITALASGTIYAVYKSINSMDSVRKGLKRIRNGETSYKIPECKSAFAASLADDINAIGDGIEKAVEQSVKSERMKAELITNVSHDLKTPLTSIINYTDLLMNEHLMPEDANDYVKIIDKKSKKLKQLTSDLFDISKVRSGNEDVLIEKLDYKLLISQAAAELDKEMQKAELEFVIKMPKSDVRINSDGRKLSRVYENLLVNAVKYSLKGTRVYIDLYKRGSSYITEIKNIAGYKMDFADDEITERFVRGDEARTGDGSGLGLAIAKSYAELLGGDFTVKTDGDLFKAIITLNANQ